jgi:peptidoglycan/LPS O-acetylase OafA/YrhL
MTNLNKNIHPKYRPDIDGLRAVAVLAVVVFHAFPEMLKGGYVGVDIFFVISGFLISTILYENLDKNNFKFSEFYSRRIRRIFPALISILLFCWVVGWFTLLPEEYMQLGKHILSGATFVSNLTLWSESGYFDVSSDVKPLLHLWSLGIEEQFYIFWPLFIWIFWKSKNNFPFIFVLLFLSVSSFALNSWYIKTDLVGVFYSPITRIWELLSGAIIAWVIYTDEPKSKNFIQRYKNTLSIAGLITILFAMSAYNREMLFPGWWALAPVFGASALIFAGQDAIFNRLILGNRVLVLIGLISYPLYLWHWPLLAFAKIISVEVGFWYRLGIVLLSIVLAVITYFLIEKPLRFGGKNKLKVSCLIIGMSVVAYMGYAAFIRDGIPINRVKIRSANALLNGILTYKFDQNPAYRVGTCLLRENQGSEDFKSCNNTEAPEKSSILIWGDSHAGHLYPGFNAIHSKEFNILQRTISGCPPIAGFSPDDRPRCKQSNDDTINYIRKIKPERIVLAANWSRYKLNMKQLEETIDMLKKMGVRNIDLVGQVPSWENTLPKQILLYCKKNDPCNIPRYMSFGLIKNVALDDSLSNVAADSKIRFHSPYKILCTSEGCLIRTGDTGESITAWDNDHLTDAGSKKLAHDFKLTH